MKYCYYHVVFKTEDLSDRTLTKTNSLQNCENERLNKPQYESLDTWFPFPKLYLSSVPESAQQLRKKSDAAAHRVVPWGKEFEKVWANHGFLAQIIVCKKKKKDTLQKKAAPLSSCVDGDKWGLLAAMIYQSAHVLIQDSRACFSW